MNPLPQVISIGFFWNIGSKFRSETHLFQSLDSFFGLL
jgi:hypothetical protein